MYPIFRVSCLELVSEVCQEFMPEVVFSFLDKNIDKDDAPDFSKCSRHYKYFAFDQEKGPHADELGDATSAYITDLKRELALSPSRVLIHCHAGVSRSTATCLIAIMLSETAADSNRAMENLMRVTNKPWPNEKILSRAEQEDTRCQGLVDAVNAYKAKEQRRLSAYRRFNRRRGLISPVARIEDGALDGN